MKKLNIIFKDETELNNITIKDLYDILTTKYNYHNKIDTLRKQLKNEIEIKDILKIEYLPATNKHDNKLKDNHKFYNNHKEYFKEYYKSNKERLIKYNKEQYAKKKQ